MEIIIPISKVEISNLKLIDVITIVKDNSITIIGQDETGMYTEKIMRVDEDEGKSFLINLLPYLNEVINLLSELNLKVLREIYDRNVDFLVRRIESIEELTKYVNDHLRIVDIVGDCWRKLLDSSSIGRVSEIIEVSELTIPYIGHSITLHYIKEPFRNCKVEYNTLTERKVAGNLRVYVGEDLVAKMEIRTTGAMYILSQVSPTKLPNQVIETLNKIRQIYVDYINRIRSIIEKL